MSTLEELTKEIVAFRDERDWEQFHTPKELAAALSIEAAELQELFLWMDDSQVGDALESESLRINAAREIADVMIFALLFCHELEFDVATVIKHKLAENAEKYPVAQARGCATKYTEYKQDGV